MEMLTVGLIVIVLIVVCTSVVLVNRDITAIHRDADTVAERYTAQLNPGTSLIAGAVPVELETLWNGEMNGRCDPLTGADFGWEDNERTRVLSVSYSCRAQGGGFVGDFAVSAKVVKVVDYGPR